MAGVTKKPHFLIRVCVVLAAAHINTISLLISLISLDWWFCDAAPNPLAERCFAVGIGSARGRIRFNGNGNGAMI